MLLYVSVSNNVVRVLAFQNNMLIKTALVSLRAETVDIYPVNDVQLIVSGSSFFEASDEKNKKLLKKTLNGEFSVKIERQVGL